MLERRAITIRGIVQGVGFRPCVYHLALRLQLAGYVRNESGSVFMEIEGEAQKLDQFLRELAANPPALAQIEQISWERQSPLGERDFRIATSDAGQTGWVLISPDTATCDDCLNELLDPADRHYRYPFLNCTNCGPRLTIIMGSPYDRRNTTMASFPMCAACRAEYEDPGNRRFHAQPTACPACGPQLEARDGRGEPVATLDALGDFVAALRLGRIGAMKGLGGYHLVCDGVNAAAVAELRRRKHRDEKPFALMVSDESAAELLCEIDDRERELLISPRRPIVLLRKRKPLAIAEEIAPGNPWLGVMLPYTPLHHLLLRAMNGTPVVMTSGNRTDEPIAYRDEEAREKLSGIADHYLSHNRAIQVRCDDSVTRIVDGIELPIRRSRGYAPRPIELPFECPMPILAVGGQLKATFGLGRGRQAILSHHLGDLDHFEAYQAFERDLELYQDLFEIRPALIAHDLHPDYATSRFARRRSEEGSALLSVQHHHAHLASCMAEHGLNEEVIGVIFDGAGFGLDGTIWGGEFLVGDYRRFRRAAHLHCVRMPGGDQAIREPWRMALSHLVACGIRNSPLLARISPLERRTIETMLERGFNAPWTSSAGRLFDAVAALAGVRDRVSYEGQAAIELEWLATEVRPAGVYPFEVVPSAPRGVDAPLIVETRPLIAAASDDALGQASPAVIARRFHSTLVEMIAATCDRIRRQSGLETVALSGGVFLNALLTRETVAALSAHGFRVLRHRLVPPNDGGLSLGQIAIAAASLAANSTQGAVNVPRDSRQSCRDLPRA